MSVEQSSALIMSDGVVAGILALSLGLVFYTAQHPKFKIIYRYLPALLICYMLPALFNTFGLIDGHSSKIYYVVSRFMLPAALVLFILSVDLKKIVALGPKALVMFFTGTLGIVIGGPIALMIVSQFDPEIATSSEIWKGMSTIAGSWIGGGANQTAMKEMWQVDANVFGAMVAIDIIVANIWMAVLLYMARGADERDRKMGADNSAIIDVRLTVEKFEKEHARIPDLNDLMLIIAVGLGATGLSHLFADGLSPFFSGIVKAAGETPDWTASAISYMGLTSHFFWLIVCATLVGLALSFTRARQLEAAGASKIGSVFIYLLVASIGMQIDLTKIGQYLSVFFIGLIWISVHAILLLVVGKLIKAPTFFLAVGSQANVGGAASAPVVAAAFHPSLAPVGALLAILGYVMGTFAAILCTYLLRAVA